MFLSNRLKGIHAFTLDLIHKWLHQCQIFIRAYLSDDTKKLSSCDVLFFCHDVDRSIELCGTAYSPLIDSVRKDFEERGFSCISIAHPWSTLTGSTGYGTPLAINKVYLICIIKSKVCKILGVSKDFEALMYMRFLEKTKAKLIITIGSPVSLASVARDMKVFHVELLHGIGYTVLPWGWDKLPTYQLPQGILSLDDISSRTFSLLENKNIQIHTIPHPFLKLFLAEDGLQVPVNWTYKLENQTRYSRRILILLTWGYAGDHGAYTQFSNILENGLFYQEIGDLIKEEADIFWHFRLHPVQLREPRYQSLRDFLDEFVASNPNSEWRESSSLPLPSVAKICDGSLAMFSMSCYDVATMGVPTLMMCPTVRNGGHNKDFGLDLEGEGYLVKKEVNKDFIRNWIRNTQKINPRLNNLKNNSSWDSAMIWMLENSKLKSLA